MRTPFLLALAFACRQPDPEPVDADGDGVIASQDCDDEDPLVHPSAAEACNGVDDDCDGAIDDDAVDASTFYADGDGDGYGNAALTSTGCDAPAGYVADATDCDDGDGDVHPGATEDDCTDDTDYNCDGSSGFADADGDGSPACEDCDDADVAVRPGAVEICDGRDDDCDGDTDEAGAVGEAAFYADADGDGYGDADSSTLACAAPEGSTADASDCDDARADTHPGADETCDGADQDCDGTIDDGATDASTFYVDKDGDGAGGAGTTTACAAPEGYVATSDDCDDLDAATKPGATETCDGQDNDCDGALPDDEADADDDGVSACDGDCDDASAAAAPGVDERCDGADNDCDGKIDEADAVDPATFYVDGDGDGFGGAATTEACAAPTGWVDNSDDCNDADPKISPDGTESCNGKDDDCDGEVDPDDEFLGTVKACAGLDCADIHAARPSLGDGKYWVRGLGDTAFEAYCDMVGGGWTLALKADGRKQTFSYDAALWTNLALYDETSLDLTRTEAKTRAFTSLPFNQVRLEMEAPVQSSGPLVSKSLVVDHAAPSLRAVFAGGGHVQTELGRDAWKELVTNSSLQPNCNREGFNVNVPSAASVRLGIINNQENDCGSPDSRLGIGGKGNYCGQPDGMSVGNTARCSPDNGDKDIYGFGLLWVRCEPGQTDDFGDRQDQDCDGTDGVDADGDGWASEASAGADCDDADPDVFPGAGDCEPLPKSCKEIKDADSSATDGIYVVDPSGDGTMVHAVHCDMSTDGGGWTLVYKATNRKGRVENGLVTGPQQLGTLPITPSSTGNDKLDDAVIAKLRSGAVANDLRVTVRVGDFATELDSAYHPKECTLQSGTWLPASDVCNKSTKSGPTATDYTQSGHPGSLTRWYVDNGLGYIWPNTHVGPISGGYGHSSPQTYCTWYDSRVCPQDSAFEIWVY